MRLVTTNNVLFKTNGDGKINPTMKKEEVRRKTYGVQSCFNTVFWRADEIN